MTRLFRCIIFVLFVAAIGTNPYKLYNNHMMVKSAGGIMQLEKIGSYQDGTSFRDVLYLSGFVDSNACKRLSPAITEKALIILNSPGGAYYEGLCIADHIKKARADTIVSALPIRVDFTQNIWIPPSNGSLCASACAYMFVAGTKRILQGNVKLGIHNPGMPGPSVYTINPRFLETSSFYSAWVLQNALDRYNVSRHSTVREIFFSTSNEDMFWVHPKLWKDRPQLEKLATAYFDFYGYSS